MAHSSSRKIQRKEARLQKRLEEIDKHLHVKRGFCECCRREYRGEIEEHLKKDHSFKCDSCRDFDTGRCPYRKEVATVWKII